MDIDDDQPPFRVSLFAFALVGLPPAATQEWDGYGERRRRRRRHRDGHRHVDDHEFARRALQEGRARPLADILATAKRVSAAR